MPGNLPQKIHATIIREFEAKIRKGCSLCGLDKFRGALLVGYSGGADSAALLLSLSSVMRGRGHWPSSIEAVHVDHGIRPDGSRRDAVHSQNFCAERRIPFHLYSADVDATGGMGLEDAARRARRDVFRRAARELGAEAIALAHTRDDQAETVLMRLFEGAGPRGLSGIRWRAPLGMEPTGSKSQEVVIVRPLLDVSRAEVVGYLEARDAEWIEDETNADETRLRNLIRRMVLPVLRDNLGDFVAERIAASAAHLSSASDAVEAWVSRAREDFLFIEGGNVRISPLSDVALLPEAVRAGLWAAALEGGDDDAGRRSARERIIRSLDRLALDAGPSASLDLPGDKMAWKIYDSLFLGKEMETVSPPGGEISLVVPGRTLHPGLGTKIEAEFSAGLVEMPDGKTKAALDPALLPGGAVLRARLPGDRFCPPGGGGERKLKEYFIDCKIPRRERDHIPLVAAGNEVIWAVGHAVSEKFTSRPGGGEVLVLTSA